MLPPIAPVAKNIVLTSFEVTGQDLLHISENSEVIAKELRTLRFSSFKIFSDTRLAFEYFLKRPSDILVATGSIYLLGKIYNTLLLNNKKD